MSAYTKSLHALHTSVLENSHAPAWDCVAGDADQKQKRLSIYIDGYRIRLINVIKVTFPTFAHYVGEHVMQRLCEGYVEATPSHSYNIDHYALGFAAYVSRHQNEAFAAELAELEEAISRVFAMPDSDALDATALTNLDEASFANLLLKPRTAHTLLHQRWNAQEYLSAFRKQEALPEPKKKDTYLYIFRHPHQVQRMELLHAQYQLLKALFSGMPAGVALEHVATAYPAELDTIMSGLQNWFKIWVENGAFQRT